MRAERIDDELNLGLPGPGQNMDFGAVFAPEIGLVLCRGRQLPCPRLIAADGQVERVLGVAGLEERQSRQDEIATLVGHFHTNGDYLQN